MLHHYQDYFLDASKDLHQGNYVDASHDFLVPLQGQSCYNPQALADYITATSEHDMPLAMVAHCHNVTIANDVGFIQIFLHASKYPMMVMGPLQPWDGNIYALVGDILGNQFMVTPFPANNFALAQQGTWVPIDAVATMAIVANLDGLLAPVAANAPNAVEVYTHIATWVPFAYVPLLLAEPLRPKQAFQHVYGAAQMANQVNEVCPLLDYLKVATVGQANDQHVLAVMQDWPHLPQPPNAVLIDFFSCKIAHNLLDCITGGILPVHHFQPVIRAIDDLTAEQHQQCVDAQTCQAALDHGKTPLQFFGEHGVNKLMHLVQVFHEVQLPPLWSRLAAAPKMSCLMTVQSSFNEQ